MALRRADFSRWRTGKLEPLTSETVQGSALTFECVHDVHGGYGFPLGMLRVGDGIADNVLQEHLEDAACLFVDETGDSLHTSSPGKTADGGLGDTLDVVSENFTVALGTSFAESLSSFTSACHFCSARTWIRKMRMKPSRRAGSVLYAFDRGGQNGGSQWEIRFSV